jgi:hypothetical protein
MKTLNQLKCKQKKLLREQWNDDKEMKKNGAKKSKIFRWPSKQIESKVKKVDKSRSFVVPIKKCDRIFCDK